MLVLEKKGAVCVLVGFIAFLFLVGNLLAARNPVTQMREIKGNAFLVRNGVSTQITSPIVIMPGDKIVTKSGAGITFIDGSFVRMAPDSEISFLSGTNMRRTLDVRGDVSVSCNRGVIDVRAGDVTGILKKGGAAQFKVNAANKAATVSAYAGRMTVIVGENIMSLKAGQSILGDINSKTGGSHVTVLAGHVTVTAAGKSVTLAAGESVNTLPGKAPVVAARVGAHPGPGIAPPPPPPPPPVPPASAMR